MSDIETINTNLQELEKSFDKLSARVNEAIKKIDNLAKLQQQSQTDQTQSTP